MRDKIANALLLAFAAVVGALFLYVYNSSPLRDRVESKLFDIRTRLAPTSIDTSDLGVIAIDDWTTTELDGPDLEKNRTKPRNLSWRSLLRVVRAALLTDAAHIAVLVPNQIFPYGDPQAEELAALAVRDRRLVIGVFDLSVKNQSPELLPAAFKKIPDQLAKADVTRYYRREIVRDFVVKEEGELPFLPYLLAARKGVDLSFLAPERGEARRLPEDRTAVKLNYFHPSQLATWKAESLAVAQPATLAELKGKTLLIGYTSWRNWTSHDREATFVNSPWQMDGEDLADGIPVVHVQGVALANLTQNKFLRDVPRPFDLFQTFIITVATLLIWKSSVGFASFLFIGGWSLLLLLHAAAFAWLNRYLPLADAALFSSLAMTYGALRRLGLEARMRAEHEAIAKSEGELAAIQERFLDRFAEELAAINRRARAALETSSALKDLEGTPKDALVRALGSCEELDDYLNGIQQFAKFAAGGTYQEKKRLPLARIDSLAVVQKVVRQFESRASEGKVAIEVDVADGVANTASALADPTLLSQILYNLVSNAVKYSPVGGRVAIRVEPAPGRLLIRVADQGPGISPEFHERIFEKFYRVKDDSVYKLKGHGLGLYLSKYFADQIGAAIDLSSTPGKGAEFTLALQKAKGA